MIIINKLKAILKPVYRRNKALILKVIFSFKKYQVEDSIIISSETRGGSTWFMEILSNMPNTIINWEPLHELKGVVPKEFKWGERPFLPENNNDKEAYHFMDKVLRFKLRSQNSVRYCTVSDIYTSKRVLTKMVRSNLLLPWIVNNYDLKHKPIYLLRHPVATAKSQIRNIFDDQYKFPSFEVPGTINNERYAENSDYIKGLNTPLERRIALWCLHNMDIINHPENDKKWITVYYEDLVMDTEKELHKISNALNLDLEVNKINFDKPSSTDFFNEFEKDKLAQLSKWKNGLNEKDLSNIQNIFDHYDLKMYSASEILPSPNRQFQYNGIPLPN